MFNNKKIYFWYADYKGWVGVIIPFRTFYVLLTPSFPIFHVFLAASTTPDIGASVVVTVVVDIVDVVVVVVVAVLV